MDERTIEIELHAYSIDRENQNTSDLARHLGGIGPSVNIVRIKKRSNTMDLGNILQVTVQSAALVALASGIADWLRMRNTASISVSEDGKVVIERINSKSATEALSKLLEHRNARPKSE